MRELHGMRHFTIVLTALACLAAETSAVAQPASQSGAAKQCFRTSDIDNSVQASQTQLNLKTRDNRYFQIQTKGVCFVSPNVDPYVLNVHGSDQICDPIDVDLSAGPAGFKTPCLIDKITPMTKAQIMALPKKQQP
jgi:hypothetical protein